LRIKQVAYRTAALKTLRRMPEPAVRRIREKVDLYASEPAALANNVAALKGSAALIRLRVGGWRVIMKEDADLIDVLDVMPRGKDYKP
jgi:mRNA interferase RelE/StbE